MGTDIELFAEVKRKGKWMKVGEVFDWPESMKKLAQKFGPKTDQPYMDRNYELFSILADARNSFGLTPISKPRGIPKDISKELKDKLNAAYIDQDIKPSWVSLKELLDFDWDKKIRLCGIVDEANYKIFVEQGTPQLYEFDFVFRAAAQLFNPSHPMSKQIVLPEHEYLLSQKKEKKEYRIIICWTKAVKDMVDQFYALTLPQLKKLDKNPANIRIVFYFN